MAAPAKRPQPHHRSCMVVRAIYQTAPIRDSACSHASYAMMLCGYPCSDTHGDPRNLTVCGSLFHLDIPSTTPSRYARQPPPPAGAVERSETGGGPSQPTRQPMRLLPWRRGRRCRTRQRAPERRRHRRRPAHAASTDATSMTIQASPRIPAAPAYGPHRLQPRRARRRRTPQHPPRRGEPQQERQEPQPPRQPATRPRPRDGDAARHEPNPARPRRTPRSAAIRSPRM